MRRASVGPRPSRLPAVPLLALGLLALSALAPGASGARGGVLERARFGRPSRAHAFEWQGRLARLRRQAFEGTTSERVAALRALSRYPASSVADTLLRALESETREVRLAAAQACGRVRLTAAVPPLVDWIDSDSASLRAEAITALGQIGEDAPRAAITRALGDVDDDVRRAAVTALGEIGHVHGGASVIEPLTARLNDDDDAVRTAAIEALARLAGDRVVVALIGRTRDSDPSVRLSAYRALGRLEAADAAIPALLNGVLDDEESVRLAAIVALGRTGRARVVGALEDIGRTSNAREGRAALNALASLASPQATRAIIRALGRPELRDLAADLLRGSSDAELTPLLVDQLGAADSDSYRDAVATALAGRLEREQDTDRACAALAAHYDAHPGSDALLRAMGTCGDPNVLIVLLEQLEHPTHAAAALDAVERHFARHPADPRAVEPLVHALQVDDVDARVRLLRLIGELGQRRALGDIRSFLESDVSAVRLAAIEAMGALGDPAGGDALLALLPSDDPAVRHAAALALADAAGPEATQALARQLRRAQPADRHALLTALSGPLARGTDGLDAEGRASLLHVLTAFAHAADEPLGDAAVETLGRWSAPEAQAALDGLLTPATPRGRARRILWALRRRDALPRLRSALAERELRGVAALALGESHVARLLAGEEDAELSADVSALEALLAEGAWPSTAAAAFALARVARAGGLPAEEAPALCAALVQHRSALVRANVVSALAGIGARCPGIEPTRLTSQEHHTAVRAAAVHWAHALTADPVVPGCDQARAFDPGLREACAAAPLPPLASSPRDDLDLYAYDSRQRVLRGRLVAVRLADGTVLPIATDARGRLRLEDAPAGLVQLEPVITPPEPQLERDALPR